MDASSCELEQTSTARSMKKKDRSNMRAPAAAPVTPTTSPHIKRYDEGTHMRFRFGISTIGPFDCSCLDSYAEH